LPPGNRQERYPASLDVTGWNYLRRYNLMWETYPDKPIIYSESASALSTRGFYELPLPTKKTEYSKQMQVNSYDHTAADWSDIADREFDLMEKDKFVAGEFVWTGFDYIGEPTPFDQEARSSYFGIVDLCGIPKDRFYFVSQLLAAGDNNRTHPAALELAGPHRQRSPGVCLFQRR